MNGVHDLGGVDGFGPVHVELGEPVFHAPWERTVFGMAAALSVQRITNTHAFRHAIERMDPVFYLTSSYYEHWLTCLATMLVERGVVSLTALEARAGGRVPLAEPLRATPPTSAQPSGAAPRFAVGHTVVVRNAHPLGHTRCPRYVRGKRGLVTRVDAAFALPDIAAHSDKRCRQFTYCVRFDGRELWGDSADAASAVHVDLWESYLDTP